MAILVSGRNIIKSVAGVIYEMHPYHMPEGIDVIIGKLNDYFDSNKGEGGSVDDVFKCFKWESWNDMYKWMKEFLKSIPEFRELNVSRCNKDKNIKYGDDENNGFKLTDRYMRETKDGRYTDFIDLDACTRNIANEIQWSEENQDDCFLCEFAKNYGSTEPSDCEACRLCTINPNYGYNRKPHPMSLKPKNQWTEEEKEKYEFD